VEDGLTGSKSTTIEWSMNEEQVMNADETAAVADMQDALPEDSANRTNEETTSLSSGGALPLVSWDHSNRRVMVKNVLKFLRKGALEKMVDSWIQGCQNKVKLTKIKKPPQDNWVLLTLEKEDQVPILMDYINSQDSNCINKKGERLRAVKMDEESEKQAADNNDAFNINSADADRSTRNKRRRDHNNDSEEYMSKRQKGILQRQAPEGTPRIVTPDEIKDAMIPLWRNTYKQQLETKERELVRKCAIKVVKEIKDKFRQLDQEAKRNKNRKKVEPYAWLNKKRAIEVQDFLPSKSIVRNKCEFTFGYRHVQDDIAMEQTNHDTPSSVPTTTSAPSPLIKRIPSVGFMARGWSGGVAHPQCCRNIPSEAIAIVDIVESFLQTCPMPPYDTKLHTGFWRTMTVRSSRRAMECMIIFVHAPISGGAGSKDSETTDNYSHQLFDKEKARLLAMLVDRDLPVLPAALEECNGASNVPSNEATTMAATTLLVTSIFFQEFDGISLPLPDHPVQVSPCVFVRIDRMFGPLFSSYRCGEGTNAVILSLLVFSSTPTAPKRSRRNWGNVLFKSLQEPFSKSILKRQKYSTML
jgi:hypothetical protein